MLTAFLLCTVMIWKNSSLSVRKSFLCKSTVAFPKQILCFQHAWWLDPTELIGIISSVIDTIFYNGLIMYSQ